MKTLLTFLLLVCGAAHAGTWKYETDVDKMTGKTVTFARLESNNSLSLEFPYSGSNRGTLWVRQSPRSGLNVIVNIDKGQILCSNYDGCSVKVRFGDAQPVTFSANPDSSHDSTMLYISNAKKFVEQAKKAKSIKIQLDLYRAGGQVLEFDSPTPLVWK